MKILYITWDGPQVNYLESLFLPTFSALSAHGINFHIVQFTWGNPEKIERTRKLCADAGFTYQSKLIPRRAVAFGSLTAVLLGANSIRNLIKRSDFDAIMPRSTLPALITLLALRGRKKPIVFDADGLPLDERVDFQNQSSSSLSYRFLRDIEAQTVRQSKRILTRSSKAVDILISRAGAGVGRECFHVVGNGRDPNVFSPGNKELRAATRDELGIPEKSPLIVYAGSIGPQYCLDQMALFFKHVHSHRPDARLLMLTGTPLATQSAFRRFPELAALTTVLSVPGDQVPRYLACSDIGLAFREKSFSMQGVSPIKIGEYLLCGTPVIASRGIGDTQHHIKTSTGYLLDNHNEESLWEASRWFIDTVTPAREKFRIDCRVYGENHFSLEHTARNYLEALTSISQ